MTEPVVRAAHPLNTISDMRRNASPFPCDVCRRGATLLFGEVRDGNMGGDTCAEHAAEAGLAMPKEERYWPFPVKPEAEWTERDRDTIEFMRQACAEGFRPREDPCASVEAGVPSGRRIVLVFRGCRNGWEPFMTEGDRPIRLGPIYGLGDFACVCVRPPFRAAGRFALEWLRGRELQSLLTEFDFVGGYPSGIALRAGPGQPIGATNGAGRSMCM